MLELELMEAIQGFRGEKLSRRVEERAQPFTLTLLTLTQALSEVDSEPGPSLSSLEYRVNRLRDRVR